MDRPNLRLAAAALVACGVLAACGSDAPATEASPASAPVMDPGDGGNYRPQLDPAAIADVIDNPYMPLAVGSAWRYEGDSDGEQEVTEIVVTSDRRIVMGISAVVVRDTVTVNGELVEDTYDWYTQDSDGNVWYLGEDTKEYEGGAVVSTAGSWEAGVDGALPGIVMPAVARVGDVLRQEYLAGEAEDMMTITGVGVPATVGETTYPDVVTTRDWTPLEPDVVEEKSYARGVGKISEVKLTGDGSRADVVQYTLGT